MNWTTDAILEWAPDAITYERARTLSSRRIWSLLEYKDTLLWGICKSSGTQVYHVVIDVQNSTFLCACPSTKNPCKHVLALLLLWVNRPYLIKETDNPPQWVLNNIAQATTTSSKGTPISVESLPGSIPVSDKRFRLMKSGIMELETWLKDLIREGWATAESQEDSFWDDFAARMVDAQLGSVGKRIRLMKFFFQQANWEELLLMEVADLFLFCKGFQNFEQLASPLQQELLKQGGVNIKKDTLLHQEGIQDDWLIIGKVEGTEENLRFRRSWLLGKETGQFALILDFVFGRQSFPVSWDVGNAISGKLVFYPGASSFRAVLKNFKWYHHIFDNMKGYKQIEDFIDAYLDAIAQNPWMSNFPGLLEDVRIKIEHEALILFDQQKAYLPLACEEELKWKLLAISGGHPILLFGEWNGRQFSPLSALVAGRLVSFSELA